MCFLREKNKCNKDMKKLTKYEELIAEYENEVLIEERPIQSCALYADGVTWIRQDLSANKKRCLLAEEIGHYFTSTGDVLEQSNLDNEKQELKARRWAYEKLLPEDTIYKALRHGYTEIWELSEYLDVDEDFLKDALRYYGLLSI